MEKICILNMDISLMGGLEITTFDLARNIMYYGSDVEIITCRHSRMLEDIQIPIKNIGIKEKERVLSRDAIARICKQMADDNCNKVIVQLNTPHRNCLLANISLVKELSRNMDVYITLHNSPVSFISRYQMHGESKAMYFLKFIYTSIRYKPQAIIFFKRAEKYIKRYLTLSEGCKKELIDAYGIKSEIQYNPYFLKQIDCSSKKKIVLWSGRLSREKNLVLLLYAWKRLSNNEWTLMIAGEGEEKASAKKLIAEESLRNVELLGAVPHRDLCTLMGESSIFVLTSFHEGFPTVIAEAMNMRNAVITTRYDGISDELINRETAITVGMDAGEIAEALNRLICDDELRKKMQDCAHEKCKEYADKSQRKPVFLE